MISDQIYSLDLSHLLSVDLNEMDVNIKRAPYASNLRMLRLLSLKAQNNILFDKFLSEDAILIPDRRLLKRRLNSIEDQKINISENRMTIDGNNDLEFKELGDFNTKTEFFAAKEDLLSKEIVEKQKNVQIEEKTSENAVDSKKLEIKSKSKESDMKENSDETQIPKYSTPEQSSSELSDFAKWLKQKSAPSLTKSQNHINPSEKLENSDTKSNNLENEWSGLQEKILAQYQGTNKKAIPTVPKIFKSTTEKKKKKEKEDIIETPFITETYALLLEKQKKYQKALKIYDKLCLLFPEKKPYFAQKIEILKNL